LERIFFELHQTMGRDDMKKYHNSVLILALTFIFVAVVATSAFAEVGAFVAVDNEGNYYQYNYDELSASYSKWQLNQSDVIGNLYKDFATVANNTKAILNSQGQYVSYENVQGAYSGAQENNQAFNVNSYVEDSAPLYAMPASITAVTMDEQSNIVKTIVNLTTGPTASNFKLTGGEGVVEVTGTAVGNEITFAVVPDATYTGASVRLSEEVHVTVTHPGIKEREASPLVDPGDLIADATMLVKFGLEKTSATGAELIAKTANESIKVTLASTADETKTTTYTLTFVEKQ